MRTAPGRGVLFLVLVVVMAASGSILLAAKFKSTWKAPGTAPLGFAGKKVVALVLTDDQNLEISGEEALARELAARGVDGVPAYRMIPREELRNTEKAKAWFSRGAVAGIVALRPLSSEKEVTYTPDTWISPYYSTWTSFYGYGWGSMYIPGSTREDTVVTVQILVFNVPEDKLLWAGVSEKTNPKGVQQIVADLVKESIKEMGKVGLVPKGAK